VNKIAKVGKYIISQLRARNFAIFAQYGSGVA